MNPTDLLEEVVPPLHGALRHELVKRLLRGIFEGKLPAGTRLIVMKLAERFGTSSTPCREALVELAGVGVVEFVHNRGAVVAPFGPTELREIYQIRRILETEAAWGACGQIDPESLKALWQEMGELIDGNRDARWSERETANDQRLHALISGQCNSVRLAKEIRRYDVLVQTVREVIGYQPKTQRLAIKEHLGIIDALLAGNPDQAAAAMAQHITSAARIAEAAMFDNR